MKNQISDDVEEMDVAEAQALAEKQRDGTESSGVCESK